LVIRYRPGEISDHAGMIRARRNQGFLRARPDVQDRDR
jgi:hypothetical protein